jgi:hypothetical protein
MTSTPLLFPCVWKVPLEHESLLAPVCVDALVIAGDAGQVRGFSRDTGAEAWRVPLASDPQAIAAVDGGAVVVSIARKTRGSAVTMLDLSGQVRWALPEPWLVARLGVAGAGDRVLISGGPASTPGDRRLWELSTGDGSVLRSVPGHSRATPVAVGGGWAWIEVGELGPGVRLLDDDGDRVLAAGQVQCLASTGDLLFAAGPDGLRAWSLRSGRVWEGRGDAVGTLGADASGVASASMEGDDVWVHHYELDGTETWRAGPFRSPQLVLHVWNDVVVATRVQWGELAGTALFDRRSGEVIAREAYGWSSITGRFTGDAAAMYVTTFAPALTRREIARPVRIEDAWDDLYLIAVAAQLDWWLDGSQSTLAKVRPDASLAGLRALLDALRGRGATIAPSLDEASLPAGPPDLSELRDTVAAIREAGREVFDPLGDPAGWLACTARFPLERTSLDEDLPARRIEILAFDERREQEDWAERHRIASYLELRYLSLALDGLSGGPIGIDLGALPRLEYLLLSENVLSRIPPEVRTCQSLAYLSLRANDLTSIDPAELPGSLRRLDVSRNPIQPAAIERLRAALPACEILYHSG